MRSPYGLEIVESCLRCRLRTETLFCNLPPRSLDTLQALGFATACPKGSVLNAEGQSAREISIVCQGHVKISTASQTGRRICLGIAGPGTVLGLSAAISRKPQPVTIETLEPCQLRIIKADRFLALLRNDQAACFAAATCLSNDVRKMPTAPDYLGCHTPQLKNLLGCLSGGTCTKTMSPKVSLVFEFL